MVKFPGWPEKPQPREAIRNTQMGQNIGKSLSCSIAAGFPTFRNSRKVLDFLPNRTFRVDRVDALPNLASMNHALCQFRAGVSFGMLIAASVLLADPRQLQAADGVNIKEADGKLRIEVNGELFSEYHYAATSRPFLYPILGPGGSTMTRNWPMKEVGGEEQDHPHHKSLWWTHGEVNGVDFWSESNKAGRTLHDRFLEIASGKDFGVIKSRNKLVTKEGLVVGEVDFNIRIHASQGERTLDWETTIRATEGELKFGDTKEGTMGIRLNETMRLKPNKDNVGKPTGHIVNSEGIRDDQTWGKRAAWVDYYGPVDGQVLGVAMFDHPSNTRHPTWWHVRDYGLFAANPFGVHDFEKKPAGTGELVVPKGETLTFRYRFYLHRGDEKEGRVADRYREYIDEKLKK
jgi:hypothetical protein